MSGGSRKIVPETFPTQRAVEDLIWELFNLLSVVPGGNIPLIVIRRSRVPDIFNFGYFVQFTKLHCIFGERSWCPAIVVNGQNEWIMWRISGISSGNTGSINLQVVPVKPTSSPP